MRIASAGPMAQPPSCHPWVTPRSRSARPANNTAARFWTASRRSLPPRSTGTPSRRCCLRPRRCERSPYNDMRYGELRRPTGIVSSQPQSWSTGHPTRLAGDRDCSVCSPCRGAVCPPRDQRWHNDDVDAARTEAHHVESASPDGNGSQPARNLLPALRLNGVRAIVAALVSPVELRFPAVLPDASYPPVTGEETPWPS
jgi:hypothetical protein